MNEDERAAGKEQEEMHPFVYLSNVFTQTKTCNETELQRTFNPTWIHSEKKHVEKDGSQKESP